MVGAGVPPTFRLVTVTVTETVVTGSVMETVTVSDTGTVIDTVNTEIHGYISRTRSK